MGAYNKQIKAVIDESNKKQYNTIVSNDRDATKTAALCSPNEK